MAEMTADDQIGQFSVLYWDDVVDVICAGSGPGALAQAILCADLGLNVVLADAVNAADLADDDTLAYLQAMIDDLGLVGRSPQDLDVPLTRAVPEPPPSPKKGRHGTVAPFVGSRLRDWAAHCAASPFGVIYSAVPDGMMPMRTDAGQAIRAAVLGAYRPDAEVPYDEQFDAVKNAPLLILDDLGTQSSTAWAQEKLSGRDAAMRQAPQ